jgi:single-strand DNA-binding protein
MPNLNRVFLIGNLTRDPQIRYTPKGTAVADIGLAVNRVLKTEEGERREEVTYVDVVLWGRVAEIAHKYLKKGRPVFIEGRLQLDAWDDKQTGQKRSRLRVVGESLQLLGGRPESEETASPLEPSGPDAAGAAPRAQPKDPMFSEEPDDIPF